MTQLLNLPLLSVTIATGTNEDWLDALQFLDASGTPISLDGIAFTAMLRAAAADTNAQVIASTLATFNGLPRNGTLSLGGTSDSVLSFSVPVSVMSRLAPLSYALDVIGVADGHQRRVVAGTVAVALGVTR